MYKLLLPYLVILVTFISVNAWSPYPIGNTTIDWIICVLTIFSILIYKKKFFHPINYKDYRIVNFYFIWMIIGCIRGAFVADNYWEWKQLISGVFSLSLPFFVYVFENPGVVRITLKFWFKYALTLFFIFFIWILNGAVYHFYLGPVILMSCFLPLLSRKWIIILSFLLLLMIFSDFSARSQVLKAFFVILIAIGIYYRRFISQKFLRLVSWFFIVSPILFLILGVFGIFNVFSDFQINEGKYKQVKMVDGSRVEEDLASDTRTFIYIEVIESALLNNYWFFGRTPARGNDSPSFGSFKAEDLNTGKYERHRNELCFPNVFTWLGLPGMILYILIYLKSIFLSLYRSNNIFIKFLGVFISFRFFYGWIEDVNDFNVMNITLWMIIGMCFSEKFRNMSDSVIKNWIKSIL